MAERVLHTKHKLNRLKFIRSYINPDNMDGKYFYEPMHSTFHLLLRAAPVQKINRNSPHVTKVMFFWVVARPKLISGRYSNGKVGCWPIARLSNDRASGSWIISISESSAFDNYKQMMIEKVLPALRSGCPRSISHNSDGTPKVLYTSRPTAPTFTLNLVKTLCFWQLVGPMVITLSSVVNPL